MGHTCGITIPAARQRSFMQDKKFIGFYVSKAQAKKIQAAAKQDGRSVSSYLRLKVLEGVPHLERKAAQ